MPVTQYARPSAVVGCWCCRPWGVGDDIIPSFKAAAASVLTRALGAHWLYGASLAVNSSVASVAPQPEVPTDVRWCDLRACVHMCACPCAKAQATVSVCLSPQPLTENGPSNPAQQLRLCHADPRRRYRNACLCRRAPGCIVLCPYRRDFGPGDQLFPRAALCAEAGFFGANQTESFDPHGTLDLGTWTKWVDAAFGRCGRPNGGARGNLRARVAGLARGDAAAMLEHRCLQCTRA